MQRDAPRLAGADQPLQNRQCMLPGELIGILLFLLLDSVGGWHRLVSAFKQVLCV